METNIDSLPNIAPCVACGYHMDSITATEWERVGDRFSLHYQCPICGIASMQGLTLEEAQHEWNTMVLLLGSI